jgi:hypothetical protein
MLYIHQVIMPAKKPVSAPVAAPATKMTKTAEKVPEAVSAPAVVEPEVEVSSPLTDLVGKVGVLATAIKDLQVSLKTLSKEYERMKKLVEKTERKRANARTQPSGFAKPTKISDEMCDFLEVPRGTEMSRTDVTRKINAYVKQHNLNKPDNKRIILPDAKLKKILGVTGNEEVSFFVLQRYIKNHFIKTA